MYGVRILRFGFRVAHLKYGILAATVFCLACVPATVSAQNRKIEQFGTVFQALLPLAGAFCAYRQSDVSDYSTRFIHPPDQDDFSRPPHENNFGDTSNDKDQMPDDVTFLAGRDAAVSGAEYLTQNCVSGVPSQAVVGGLAVLANASDFVFKDQEVGLFSMGALVGFRNDNLKFKVSRHSVKLRFELDF